MEGHLKEINFVHTWVVGYYTPRKQNFGRGVYRNPLVRPSVCLAKLVSDRYLPFGETLDVLTSHKDCL